MISTTQGAMTPADLEELRRDYDWDELNHREPEPDECKDGRLLTDDCEACDRY